MKVFLKIILVTAVVAYFATANYCKFKQSVGWQACPSYCTKEVRYI